jgi:hypothetical protein
MSAWDDMLDEFRALGGTADNIRLDHGEFGRGLFPVNPAKPVVIQVPENLIIDVKDMVFADGRLRVGPDAKVSDRERAWLDRYQEDYAWGGGGADEARRAVEMAAALPADLRDVLIKKYHLASWFQDTTEELVRDRFFNGRAINYRDREVIMPMVELANHGQGNGFDFSNGIAVKGTFPGEVFVQYAEFDSYEFFRTWGFATPRPVAFSAPLAGSIQSTSLKIELDFAGTPRSPRDWIPSIDKTEGTATLSFLMLGNQKFPRLPKGIFYRLMRDSGYSGFEEAFDLVQHTNRLLFLDLIAAVDGIDLPMARTLRTMALFQLRAMSFCFGVREID